MAVMDRIVYTCRNPVCGHVAVRDAEHRDEAGHLAYWYGRTMKNYHGIPEKRCKMCGTRMGISFGRR